MRLVEHEGGLAFAAVGVRPERRLLFEAVYAFLTLQNGVPIGYVLNSALYGSAEIAYNVFWTTPPGGTATWRLSSDMYAGGEGGWSGHADWFNGWDPAILSAWVNNCVRAGNDCHVSNLGDGRTLFGFFS
jgi:hypothetical protein